MDGEQYRTGGNLTCAVRYSKRRGDVACCCWRTTHNTRDLIYGQVGRQCAAKQSPHQRSSAPRGGQGRGIGTVDHAVISRRRRDRKGRGTAATSAPTA